MFFMSRHLAFISWLIQCYKIRLELLHVQVVDEAEMLLALNFSTQPS